MPHAEDSQTLSDRLADHATTVLSGLLAPHEPVAVVDYPYSDNFGDAAIWAGQNALLDRLGHQRRYVCDVGRYDAADLRVSHPDGPILLHGGGNFGDYWPEHQRFRELVLADFPGRRIVQLPQTVGFQDRANMHEVGRRMSGHPDFTLLARDEASVRLGLELGLKTELCPDSATHLGPLRPIGAADIDILVLARTDHESSGLLHAARHWDATEVSVEEWRFERVLRARWTTVKAVPRLYRRLPADGGMLRHRTQPVLSASYDALAATSVAAAIHQLSRARVLVTDRLHAHVLATLLGIPNVVLDNNYGKVSGIFDAFTHTSAVAEMAASPQQARVRAAELLATRFTP